MPTDATAAASVNTPPKPGWQTSEFWVHVIVMGALIGAGERLVAFLPTLATMPNVPSWVSAVVPLAVTGLGFVLKWMAADYQQARNDLKLGNGPGPATDAAAAAVVNK